MLEALLQRALNVGHPGIDEAGVQTMRDHVEAGRFPPEHFIAMWAQRMENFVPDGARSPSLPLPSRLVSRRWRYLEA